MDVVNHTLNTAIIAAVTDPIRLKRLFSAWYFLTASAMSGSAVCSTRICSGVTWLAFRWVPIAIAMIARAKRTIFDLYHSFSGAFPNSIFCYFFVKKMRKGARFFDNVLLCIIVCYLKIRMCY